MMLKKIYFILLFILTSQAMSQELGPMTITGYGEDAPVVKYAENEINHCCNNEDGTQSSQMLFICSQKDQAVACLRKKLQKSNTRFTLNYRELFTKMPPKIVTFMHEKCDTFFRSGDARGFSDHLGCLEGYLKLSNNDHEGQKYLADLISEHNKENDKDYDIASAHKALDNMVLEMHVGGMLELACGRANGDVVTKENALGSRYLYRKSIDTNLPLNCNMLPAIGPKDYGQGEDHDAPKDMTACLHSYYSYTSTSQRSFNKNKICKRVQGELIEPFITELTANLTIASLNDYIDALRIEAIARFMKSHQLLVGEHIPSIPNSCSKYAKGMEGMLKQDLAPKEDHFNYDNLDIRATQQAAKKLQAILEEAQ
jgi:hypothetical protein